MDDSTKKFLIIVIAVIAVLSIVACVACVACGSFGSSNTPTTSTSGTTNPSSTTPSSSEPDTYRVGDIITVSTYSSSCQFSIQEVKRGSAAWSVIQSANMFNSEPDAGYEYIMYNVWIKNTGSSKLSVASYNFPVYASGVEGEFTFVVLPDNYHSFTSSSELLSGGETSGWIVKEIPANSDCKIVYENILGTVYAYVQV